jgi:hypothetical protein
MNRPVSRLGCVSGLLILLCLVTVPLFVFVLAVRGELTWRRSQFVEDRLWLINADNASADERGLGYSASRVISDQTATDGPLCVRTRVYFVLWQGRSDQLELCDCYLRAANAQYEASGSCP